MHNEANFWDLHPTPLRIGFVSPDFRQHAVIYFLLPFLRACNQRHWQLYGYSNVRREDAFTQATRACMQTWRNTVDVPDDELIRTIQEDKIDILVDLAGHTEGNRLPVFAQRPAPVQVNWLGYVNTTGLAAFDYRLTDRFADPPEEQGAFCREPLHRLPGSFFCYLPPAEAVEVAPPPCLNRGYITFGCFNYAAKINGRVIALWARILQTVPDAHLRLVANAFRDRQVADRFLAEFARHDIAAARIHFVHQLSMAQYMDYHRHVDICLDTFPHNGHTITCHALWQGVPVLTLSGDRYASRMGSSVLNHLGLTDWVAVTQDEYVAKACLFATAPAALAQLRSSVRKRFQDSILLDAPAFARDMDTFFQQSC